MNIDEVFSIGLMSGTSLDGIDLVYVKFKVENYSDFSILYAETIPYSIEWKETLQKAIRFSSEELKVLDFNYGKFLGSIICQFIEKFSIDKIDFIASHGHTILHQPKKGITLQIGDGNEIANKTRQKVVYDFRAQDVALGGQGAPLVPVGDELLFNTYDFCLNLGGFSNISFKQNNQRIAFDICPVNIVLNHYAKKIGFDFDASGRIASKGKVNEELLLKLNRLNFYNLNPPKSLGLEWVQQEIFPLIANYEKDISIILRTFTEHIAIQISKVIKNNNSVLVTGGGAFNIFLMERVQFYTKNTIQLPPKILIDFKEALIFSFLGLLRINNQNNCLQSVTGASRNHSSGKVILPNFNVLKV